VPSIENEDLIFLEEWNRRESVCRVSAAGAKRMPPGTSDVMPLNPGGDLANANTADVSLNRRLACLLGWQHGCYHSPV